ncbi:lambda-exonuclease family protein [Dehalobacter sp.]|uniref:YqaJ viral recombinase family nuclease n=1 Tax=Dehalobacter sp. TaxID=1962289 RepID=UPI00258BA46C|nr:YqaJ viral recombinase family protein [Dehalobacter sp.]MDJ0305108.1 YqaJ viral recombinase family protein [Dehalobacter sp.]
MAKVLVSTRNMDNKEWLEWRKKGIGGSDASIACGLNRYKSPVELWMEKTGQIEPKESGEAAYWGKIMEPLIRVEFVERTGLQIKPEYSILQHSDHPFMLANLDGIVTDPINGNCVFEAKTASVYKSGEWVENIPEEYQLQVQHYLSVTGFSGAYVAVLIGGNQFKWHFISKDDELISMLIELEREFWHCVETLTPPPFDGSDASSELLDRLYPSAENKSQITLPKDSLSLVKQYENAQCEEKVIKERKEEAINKIKGLMGNYEIAVAGDRLISWKNIVTEHFDSKLLKIEQPEIYEKYLGKTNYRRFSIK